MTQHTDPVPRPRIVVGVDGSEHSRLALRWAARTATAEVCGTDPPDGLMVRVVEGGAARVQRAPLPDDRVDTAATGRP